MHCIGWNDKLLANTTHRRTSATVAVARATIVRIEVQVPSAVSIGSVERRTPNVTVVAYMVKK